MPMKAKGIALLSLLLAAHSGLAQEDLNSLKQKYEGYIAERQAAYQTQLTQWERNYLLGLQTLKARAQTAGELDTVLAIRAEDQRFRQTRRLPDVAPPEQPAALRAMQEAAAGKPGDLSLSKARDVVAVTTRYAERLDDLQKRLTTEGQIELAQAAFAERERVLQSPPFTAAQFELAMLDAAHPLDPPTPPANPADPPKDRPQDHTRLPADKGKVRGITIYEGNTPLPPQKQLGYTLRNLPLFRTPFSSLGSGIVLRTQQGSRQDDMEYWNLRVVLRTIPAQGTIPKPRVVAQFYVRDSRPGGQSDPQLHVTKRIRLTELSTAAVTLDFPPVVLHLRRHRSYSGEWQDGGRMVVGVILSVFDHEDKLLHQEASARPLLPVASDQIPGKTNEERFDEITRELSTTQQALTEAARAAAAKPDNEELSQRCSTLEERLRNLRSQANTLRDQREREGW